MTTTVDQVVGLVDAAMRLEETRAHLAARNIALANTPDARTAHLDVTSLLDRLRGAMNDPAALARELDALRAANPEDMATYEQATAAVGGLSLDAQVAELSEASGRYQALAEGLTRQFALMQLAMGRMG